MSGEVSNRILDIVFVLDTTWSMDEKDPSGKPIINRMNDLVKKLMAEILADSQASDVTEIAFLTFADDITMETKFRDPVSFTEADFVPLRWKQKVTLKSVAMDDYTGVSHPVLVPQFSSVGTHTSSRIGRAVQYAIKKLFEERDRQRKLHGENVKFYAPIMILITDGAPANRAGQPTMDPEEERKAINLVYRHCKSTGDAHNLVYPIICGIGDEQVEKHLSQYSKGYTAGFQHIKKTEQSKGFKELFEKIGISITRSFDLNEDFNNNDDYAQDPPPRKGKHETYRERTLNDIHGDEDEEI